jgi:hypothetical protein
MRNREEFFADSENVKIPELRNALEKSKLKNPFLGKKKLKNVFCHFGIILIYCINVLKWA